VETELLELSKERQLITRIAAICLGCSHMKWIGGQFGCDRKRSECHSARVRSYLAQLDRLKDKTEGD